MPRTSKIGIFTLVSLGIAALTASLGGFQDFRPAKNSTSEEGGFELTFSTHSLLDVKPASVVRVEDSAVVARTYPGLDEFIPLQWAGNSRLVNVDRYEASWEYHNFTPYFQAGETGLAPIITAPTKKTTMYANVSFEYLLDRPGSAFVGQAETMVVEATEGLRVRGALSKTNLVAGRNGGPGAGYHEDERQRWSTNETNLLIDPRSDFTGEAEGAMRLYWTRSTLTLQLGDERIALESRVWDDENVNVGRARARHAVWYELRMDDGYATWRNPAPQALLQSVIVGRNASIPAAVSFAVDSQTAMHGTLPDSNTIIGSSLWVEGNMSARIAPAYQVSPLAEQRFVPYHATFSGSAHAYAYSGGPIIPWPHETVVGVSVGLAASVALAWFLYAKLRGPQLLNHPERHRLYRLIQEQPGIYFLALRRAVRPSEGPQAGFGKTLHHLDQLERFGLVRSMRVGRHRCFFPTGGRASGHDLTVLTLKRNAGLLAVANQVVASPGVNGREILKRMGHESSISPSTLGYHVRRLVELEYLVRTKGERTNSVNLWPTPGLVEAVKALQNLGSAAPNPPDPAPAAE